MTMSSIHCAYYRKNLELIVCYGRLIETMPITMPINNHLNNTKVGRKIFLALDARVCLRKFVRPA